MSYKALYRTYRPKTFDDVVGQQHIVKTLKNAISKNKLAHAYLFCGPRGTGKTSIAKLLAKAINCEHADNAPCNECDSCIAANENRHADIVEIDAASNNSVENIRDLIEKVKYAPLMGKYKVYIIDEVHMLSQGAFNALLKTLEEPPAHVIFILATTEPQKVLPTIISRCQRYNFEKVSDNDIVKRLSYIIEQENIKASEDSLRLIADLSDGGMRDALSILDQFIAYNKEEISVDDVNEVYGLTTTAYKIDMIKSIVDQDVKRIIVEIENIDNKGIDIPRLTNDLIEILKECVIYIYSKDSSLLKFLSGDEADSLCGFVNSKKALSMIEMLMEASNSYRYATKASKYFEVACLKMMELFDEEETVVKKVIKEVKVENKADETVLNVSKPISFDMDYLLSVLVKCDKTNKNDVLERFNSLVYMQDDLEHIKYIKMLMDASVVASGDDCIIMTTKYEASANMINDAKINEELFWFVYEKFNIKKMIYALTADNFKLLVEQFRNRSKNNTLPAKADITLYYREEVKPLTTQEKLVNIFGEDIEIIKE